VAEHRLTVGPKFQHETFNTACDIWEIIQSDHIFRGTPEDPITLEQSIGRCKALDGVRDALMGDGSDMDAWFAAVTSAPGW